MHAVILAAGRGTRMGRLTARAPKACLRLDGRRLIDWQLAALDCAGVDRISVVTGHAAAALTVPAPVRAVFNPQWASSGPIASFCCGVPETPDDLLLVYGDGVFHPRLAQVLCASRADIAITVDRCWQALWALRFDDVLADAESLRRRDGWLTGIGARVTDSAEIEAQFTGLVRFSSRGWQSAREVLAGLAEPVRRQLDTTALLALLLRRGVAVAAIDVDGGWCEIDSARDLALYRLYARRRPGWSHDWRWAEAA